MATTAGWHRAPPRVRRGFGTSHDLVRPFRAVACLLTGLLGSCAGSLANRGQVETTVGRATFNDIMNEVPSILRRVGYAIYEVRETGSSLYIETGWQERVPFDDEAEAGADVARTRFVARARKVGPALYTLRVTAENEVHGVEPPEALPDAAGGWSTMPATGMYKAYVLDITTEIQMKVDAGLRTYGVPGSAAPAALSS
ncbi:MAG: hypothetical protein R3E98_17705 [Gemmatimonadota bacterium]|nr:hypothetical protein [Gemmatimonadota bacterium]